jgi:predicted CopG family antitoxin
MAMTKHIPVSEKVWKELGKAKGAGETYDSLIKKMLKIYHRINLMKKMEEVESKKEEDLVDIDDL